MTLLSAFPRMLERLSLRVRLLLAFALILVLGLTPVALIEEQKEATVRALNHIVHTDMRVSELALSGIATFLDARRHEKDFLLRYREFGYREARARYATQVQMDVAELRQQMQDLRGVAGDEATREQTEEIEAAAAEYLASFMQSVELYGALAFPRRGLQPRLRDALEALSPVASSRAEPRLAAAYLALYRATLEMIDDAGAAEYERTIEALAQFERAAVAAAPAAARPAREAQAESFRELAAEIRLTAARIAEHRSGYFKAAQRVEPLLETLHVTRVKASRDAVVELHEADQMKERYLVANVAAALLLAVVLAVAIATRVARGVELLVAYTGEITKGHLDSKVPGVRGRELGQLAAALSVMAGRLRASRDALELRNAELAARHAEMSGLGQMTNSLQACLNLDEAAEVIGRFCAGAFGDDSGAVYLFKASRNYLEAMATWGAGTAAQSFPPEDCWSMRRGQTHAMIDPAKDARCAHAESAGAAAQGYYCVPMAAQGNVLGMIHLVLGPDGAAAREDRLRLMTLLADQLALALANLRLRDSLREQSIRDVLTGLYNRRFLEESLEREVARAGRSGQPLAVLMLDADHFKRFNDQFGHEVGDVVLRALGEALGASCRRSDLACRYGGEEFTVVLGQAGKNAAVQWGERLLAKVRKLEIKSGGVAVGPVTLSAGVALYPEHGQDADALLQGADAALYEAKKTGRDRLVVYQPAATVAA